MNFSKKVILNFIYCSLSLLHSLPLPYPFLLNTSLIVIINLSLFINKIYQVLGLEHKDTASLYYNLGFLYKIMGKSLLAEEYQMKYLKIKEKL